MRKTLHTSCKIQLRRKLRLVQGQIIGMIPHALDQNLVHSQTLCQKLIPHLLRRDDNHIGLIVHIDILRHQIVV